MSAELAFLSTLEPMSLILFSGGVGYWLLRIMTKKANDDFERALHRAKCQLSDAAEVEKFKLRSVLQGVDELESGKLEIVKKRAS